MKEFLNFYVGICIIAFVLKYVILFFVQQFAKDKTDLHEFEHEIEHTIRLILIIVFAMGVLFLNLKTDSQTII